MDLFKKINVKKATTFDFNASCVKLKDRSKLSRLLSRYSRRKLKQKLNVLDFTDIDK